MKRRRSSTDIPRRLAHVDSARLRSFFTVVDNNTKHQCNICQKKYTIDGDPETGTTSSLRNHLENKHAPAVLLQFPAPHVDAPVAVQQVRILPFSS
jgi:hypothetical protein